VLARLCHSIGPVNDHLPQGPGLPQAAVIAIPSSIPFNLCDLVRVVVRSPPVAGSRQRYGTHWPD
jgi:hypothetical protein